MAITAVDLISPKGRLDIKVFWPGLTEAEAFDRLNAFIADAQARAEAAGIAADAPLYNKAVLAYAYHRAYQELYNRIVIEPATYAVEGEASYSYSSEQIRAIAGAMNSYLEEFASYTRTVLPVIQIGSGSIDTEYTV